MLVPYRVGRLCLPNWRAILRKAWSVWAMALSVIFAAGEVALPLLHDTIADDLKGWCALLAGACAAGGIWLRVLPQPELHRRPPDDDEPPTGIGA